jgi:Domain of unknown function (DUF4410)
MSRSNAWGGFGLALLSLAAFGCATTNVQSTGPEYMGRLPRPVAILVYPFATSPQDIQLDTSPTVAGVWKAQGISASSERRDVAHAVSDAVADRLVEKIQAMGLPATRASEPAVSDGRPMLAITGFFTAIDQGSRAERVAIGLGAGRSDVNTTVQVASVSPNGRRVVDSFDIDAKSGRNPGTAETLALGAGAGTLATAAVATAATTVGSEAFGADVDADARRTADKIAGMLGEFFAQNGFITRP